MDDEDFIHFPRLGNSIKTFIDNHPSGGSDKQIAKALMIEEEEVEELFQSAIKKIRASLQIED